MREQSKHNQDLPYKRLGVYLKKMREKRQETMAEVSGAVEIEVGQLSDIEKGKHRPSEDILMLLMNHFSLKDDEALRLWNLAGYDESGQDGSIAQDLPGGVKQVMVLPMDARVVYTDMAHIIVNKHGVVMNFMQEAGLGGQPLAVARIGMSREHAESVLELLQKALNAKPKMLPSSGSDKNSEVQNKSDNSN